MWLMSERSERWGGSSESERRAVSNDDVDNVDDFINSNTLNTNIVNLFNTISGGVSKLKSYNTTPDRAWTIEKKVVIWRWKGV